MSFGEFYAGFSGLGGNIIAEMERAEQKRALAKLGAQASSGDYRGAAGTAFDAGDLNGGLGLLKLGEAQEQRRLTSLADADFMRGFGSGFGVGGVTGGSDGTRLPTTGAGGNVQPFKTNDPVAEDLPAHQRALLNGIAGPESAGKYNVRFTPRGGALFEGFDRHPGIAEMGPAGPSTAAGRYQFTRSTWDAMGGGDFSPANQDRRAVQLAQQDYRTRTGRDLDADLQAEGFSPRIQKVLAPTWVGLGGNQQRNAATYAESLARYGAAGGQQPTRVASADPGFAPQGGGLQSLPPGASGLNPGRPVQFADDENQTQVLESRLGMYPGNVYGVAQPPQRVASADPGFAPQTPTAPGPLSRPMGALPQGLSGAGDGRGGLPAPGGVPPSSASGAGAPAPAVGTRPAQAMPLSGDAPVQVAQAGGAPQIPPDARIGAVPVAVLNQQPLGTRIPWLMRAVGNPNLSEGNRDIAKMLFKDALAETKAPDGVKEFMWARANGMTRAANPGEYAREKLRDPGADLTGQIDARAAAAQRYGLTGDAGRDYALGYKPGDGTADERNFAAAKRDGYTGSFTDFLTSVKRAGATSITNAVDLKGESAEAQELGKERGKRAGAIEAAAMRAPDQIGKLALLGDVLDKASTGTLAPAHSTVVGLAQALGVPNETIGKLGLNPDQVVTGQIATKLTNELVTGMIGGGGFPANNFSDADRTFLQDIFPKMSNRPEANRVAVEVLKRVQQRNLEMGDAWADYQQAQRDAGKPTSVAEFEYRFRQGLRSKPDLFGDLKQQVGTLSGREPPPGGDRTTQQVGPPAGAPQGTRQAPDGKFYAPDPSRPGRYLEVR